ncbi:hypothetical protein [Blautia sp. OF01-4LB]|uniref:hypothetical protein n=1 Tax=Blautia sp. OF01-4LB TaxID=2292286 RepID=UPI000E54BEFD|nr:hypothetical protein [Blautia sp. OF01-4LB]RHP80481.1 hypothetical protein DXA40_12185 [Blautia sp. OF01-4LB]
MDRITEHTDHGIVIRKEVDICVETPEDFDNLQHILSALAAYEDLGITPDQVRQMNKEFTRASKELADYKKSVDQGRLLHLPCKVGDTVYLEAEYENEITEGRVTEISVLPDGVCIYIEREIGSGCSEGYGVNDFGYDVFLKREDAEMAIKEELDK